jgi:hypothetical protein
MKAPINRPSKLWPIGTTVSFLDAHGHNPVTGKVITHYPNEFNILVEDKRGCVHFGQTWRVATPSPFDFMFDDLLGVTHLGEQSMPAPSYDFEDLLS